VKVDTQGHESVKQVVGQLLASKNGSDRRKGNDFSTLMNLGLGQWQGRFELLGFASGPRRYLAGICAMQADGLVWSAGQPTPNSTWLFTIGVAPNYPKIMPVVGFQRPMCWCPHVVHRDFLPRADGLPPELQEYLREGEGHCCYMRSEDWAADAATHNLAIVVWQVSRILTLSKWWGEVNSLNKAARDHALRLKEEGRLPLGRPLAMPQLGWHEEGSVETATGVAQGDEDDDIEWCETQKEEAGEDAS